MSKTRTREYAFVTVPITDTYEELYEGDMV